MSTLTRSSKPRVITIKAGLLTKPAFLNHDVGIQTQKRFKKKGEWLQITFSEPKLIVGFITKGRVCGDSKQWTKVAEIQYSANGIDWNSCGAYALNIDWYSPSTNILEKPVLVKKMRFVPLSWEGAGVLKVELLGFSMSEFGEIKL